MFYGVHRHQDVTLGGSLHTGTETLAIREDNMLNIVYVGIGSVFDVCTGGTGRASSEAGDIEGEEREEILGEKRGEFILGGAI